jgi:hypothetical protein
MESLTAAYGTTGALLYYLKTEQAGQSLVQSLPAPDLIENNSLKTDAALYDQIP